MAIVNNTTKSTSSASFKNESIDGSRPSVTEYCVVNRCQVEVTCRDAGVPQMTSSRAIVVHVTDDNDNAPRLDREVFPVDVRENNLPGDVLLAVNASQLLPLGYVRRERTASGQSRGVDTASGLSRAHKLLPVGVIRRKRTISGRSYVAQAAADRLRE